ncbi:MAG: thermonuclease family protein, partial [Rhodospirillaceae bacterium]
TPYHITGPAPGGGWHTAEGAQLATPLIRPLAAQGEGDPGVPWPLPGQSTPLLVTSPDAEPGQDRHGRLIGPWHVPDSAAEDTLSTLLLRQGLAVLLRETDSPDPLRLAERQARREGLGVWAKTSHAAFPLPTDRPTLLEPWLGQFIALEGQVQSVSHIGRWVYVNFGSDWRDDVTVSFPATLLKQAEKRGLDPLTWEGATLRARGILTSRNGPMITLDNLDGLTAIQPDRSLPPAPEPGIDQNTARPDIK